jgi:hypothetical protein
MYYRRLIPDPSSEPNLYQISRMYPPPERSMSSTTADTTNKVSASSIPPPMNITSPCTKPGDANDKTTIEIVHPSATQNDALDAMTGTIHKVSSETSRTEETESTCTVSSSSRENGPVMYPLT